MVENFRANVLKLDESPEVFRFKSLKSTKKPPALVNSALQKKRWRASANFCHWRADISIEILQEGV